MRKLLLAIPLAIACATSSSPEDATTDAALTPLCGEHPCDEGLVCCLTTSECVAPGACAPSPDPDRCTSSDDCTVGECAHLGGCASALGRCISLDECRLDPPSDPACGCDGRSYDRACDAIVMGGGLAGPAACGDPIMPVDHPPDCGPGMGCESGEFCDSDAGVCHPVRAIEVCGIDANRPSGKVCCREAGFCVPADCPDCCRPLEDGELAPCTADEECTYAFLASYCDGDSCDGPGACRAHPISCDGTIAEVCGCDGATYQNACEAARAGARIASTGRCP